MLVVDEWLCWPLDNGKKIRTYNLLARLGANHQVLLLAYGDGDRERDAINELRRVGITCHTVDPPQVHKSGWKGLLAAGSSAIRGVPYSAAMYLRPELEIALHEVIRSFKPDLIHVEAVVLGPLVQQLQGVPRVLGTHNYEAQIWQRLASNERNVLRRIAYQSQAGLMSRFEKRTLDAFEGITAVSEEDAASLGRLVGRRDIAVVPNGVDLEFFAFQRPAGPPHSLVFTGALDWRPTQDAVHYLVRELFPRLREEVFDATLTVAGKDPDAHVRAAVASVDGVQLLPNVPDIRVPVRDARISVAPLRSGSGSRLKILEAMALGRPVVATTVGAEGLGATANEQILIADTPEEFSEAVLRLWRDAEFYASVARAARDFVEQHYDWNVIAADLRGTWEEAASGRLATLSGE